MCCFVLRGQLSHPCQLHSSPRLVSSCFLVQGFSCSICFSSIEFESVIDNNSSFVIFLHLLLAEISGVGVSLLGFAFFLWLLTSAS